MVEINLKASPRKKGEKKEKSIPAVVYGPEIESRPIWIKAGEFIKAYQSAGESSLINLEIEKGKKDHLVLIYDVQIHPVKDRFLHVDFFQVQKGKKLEAEVDLEYIGEPPAVKEHGGIFLRNLTAIKIKCLPKDLPKKIEIDTSLLKNIEDCIYIKDIKMPEGVTVDLEPDTVIATIAAPRSEKELEELDEKVETDIDEIEEIGEKEKEEDGESAEGEEGRSEDGEEKSPSSR